MFSLTLVKAIAYVFPNSVLLLSHQRSYFALSSRNRFLNIVSEFSFLKKQIFIHTLSLQLLGILPDIKRHRRTKADTQFFPTFEIVKIKYIPVVFFLNRIFF